MKTLTPTDAMEAYVAAWNEADGDARSAHLFACCAEDVVLLDPHAQRPARGWAAVASHIGVFRDRFEHRLQPTSGLDAHHGVCRFSWRLASGDDVMATGLIVADAASDGRLQRIVHFVDAPPPEADPSSN